MKIWKVLGLAGVAGVTATGVVIARDQRRRATVTPDEVRAGLAARYLTVGDEDEDQPDPPVTGP